MRDGPNHQPDWNRLVAVAQAVVESTLRVLPKQLQAAARTLPITYEPCPGRALIADGIEADTLGLFVGDSFADSADSPLPAQIILFLDNLWELAEAKEEIYGREVRTTLLHELGHYLGLDEDGLTERGLE
jgi:predicted Zn-dependent protease with MMP-like domain